MTGVFLLKPVIQNNAWGRYGTQSEVANLILGSDSDFVIDEKQTYAELWMGTHRKGANTIIDESLKGVLLSDWIKSHPEALGASVTARFGNELPFLFKVLSVNVALSIQAHPNKKHAELLFASDPLHYLDPNHKPEMAIALTEFEGMCGFRPIVEVLAFIEAMPELKDVIGAAAYDKIKGTSNEKEMMKFAFSAVVRCDDAVVKMNLQKLIDRVKKLDVASDEYKFLQGELLCRTNSQFPGDVGCMCIYFLNHINLKPGEAMYLDANTPHAYLSGNCMEVMANSDNVVRAGFTQKFKDVETLCEMLNYQGKTAEENTFPRAIDSDDPYVSCYNPPIDDFTVCSITLPVHVDDYNLAIEDSASIVLVIEGEGKCDSIKLHRGSVLFISANQAVKINKGSCNMLMFRAYCLLK